MTIATDSVDRELVEKPRRWNIQFIRNFMLTFGILSSVFDYLTFGVLLLLLHATTDQFRTGWFLESVISASVTVLVIRTRKSFFRSKPGKYLLMATLLIVACDDPISIHSPCRTLRFSTVANDDPSGDRHDCGALYDCSRNSKKVLLQKGEFLKRHLSPPLPLKGGEG